jgi:hypothetical protein
MESVDWTFPGRDFLSENKFRLETLPERIGAKAGASFS